MRCAQNCSFGLVKQALNEPLLSGPLRGLAINHLQGLPRPDTREQTNQYRGSPVCGSGPARHISETTAPPSGHF